ncbi:hypothetical protein JGI25_01332, partial [Candidatus Kryptobacter tengchongensis]
EGVRQGLFGLGRLEKDKPVYNYFNEDCSPEIVEGEVIIKAELCKKEVSDKAEIIAEPTSSLSVVGEKTEGGEKESKVSPLKEGYSGIYLKFLVPFGKLSDVGRIINYLKSKFSKVEIVMEIIAENGEIKKDEYEDKLIEALKQAGINEKDIETKFKQ